MRRALLGAERWNDAEPALRENGRGTFSGRRTGGSRAGSRRPPSRRRARSATPSRPPCLRRRSRPATRTRAARTRAPRPGARSGARGPGWPVATQHVRERPFAVQLEAAVDRARRARTRRSTKLRSQPLRSRTSSACARNASTRRVVAVRDRRDERPSEPVRCVSRTARPGERRPPRDARRTPSASAAGGSPPRARARPRSGRRACRTRRSRSGSSPPCRSVA